MELLDNENTDEQSGLTNTSGPSSGNMARNAKRLYDKAQGSNNPKTNSGSGNAGNSASASGNGAAANNTGNSFTPSGSSAGGGTASSSGATSGGASASSGSASAATGGSAAAGSSAAAGGSAATGGSAAAGSSAAAGGTTAATAASAGGVAAAPVILVIIIVVFIFVFVGGIFVLMTPENTQEVAEEYTEEFSVGSIFESIGDSISNFFKNIFGFNKSAVQTIEADESLYDKNNEYDVGYIHNYNAINTALNDAYQNYVLKSIADYCDRQEYTNDEKKDVLNKLYQRYPDEWKSVYENVNYGELINILALGYSTNAYGQGVERGDVSALSQFLLNSSNYQLFFNFDESASDIIIMPYCKKDLFIRLGINKDAEYLDTGITYFDMLELMNEQNKAICQDTSDGYRQIYYTLGLDKPPALWDYSHDSITVSGIFTNTDANAVSGDVPLQMWLCLKQIGYTDEGAGGVLGNLMAENGFRTTMSGEGGSVGLAQWTGTRKENLFIFAANMNKEVTDYIVQCNFAAYELSSPKYDCIKNATDVITAADYTAYFYEACSRYSSYEQYLQGRYAGKISWSRYCYSEVMNTYILDLEKRRNYSVYYYNLYKGRVSIADM